MNQSSGNFKCSDDLQLFYQVWQPEAEPQAVMVIVHGFSDHSDRYMNMVKALVPRGILIYSYDQRGHGQSPGTRGHVNQFAEFRDDLHIFFKFVSTQEAGYPIFLFGHSMGGLIILDYGLHYPVGINGVIASAPHLSDPPISPILKTLSNLMSGVWPTLSISAGLDATGLSRDPQVVKDYLDDPLVHGKGTPRLATELSDAVDYTQANAANFKPPLLMYHGTADTLTDPDASKRFFDQVKSMNKTYIPYEGGFHEGHNDFHNERVIIDIGQWIEHQITIVAQQHEEQG